MAFNIDNFLLIFPMFTKIVILCLISCVVWNLPSNASYIKANGRPLNIAHRGLASILPQNTLQAFEAALYQGADFIQLDVVYTKQKNLLVMHDPFLTRITNIRDKKQFETRYQTRMYGGKKTTNWWTDNFTLNELQTLGIKQDQYADRVSVFDYKFTFPTLGQVIEMVIAFNKQHQGKRNPDGRLAGILIEAKDSQMYRDLYGLEIGKSIIELLKTYNIETIQKSQKVSPIYLHSFDYGTIKYWAEASQLPRNFLTGSGHVLNFTDINKYATGVGCSDGVIYDYGKKQISQNLQQMRKLNLLVHVWTFKDQNPMFNQATNVESYKYAQQVLKLDGVITQFADTYAPLCQIFKINQQEQFISSFLRSETI